MNVTWLLDDTASSGVSRAVLVLADAFVERGHVCTIVTPGLPVTWRASDAQWVYVDDLARHDPAGADFVIATSPETIDAAARIGGPRSLFYAAAVDESSVRDLALPALAGVRIRGDVPAAGIAVDPACYRLATPREHQPPRVLLAGASHNESEGIDAGYGAVAHARWFHQTVELVRASPWAPSREEPLDDVQEFHVGLSDAEMTRLMHSCDVVIVPAHREQKLSMTSMEALAAGIPTLLTATPFHLAFAEPHDYAVFGPERNAVELGERLMALLGDAPLRTRLRERGREVAEQWRAGRVAERLETLLLSRLG